MLSLYGEQILFTAIELLMIYSGSWCSVYLILKLIYTKQNGMTPLRQASFNGHQDVVDVLLRAGANPDLQDKVSKVLCIQTWIFILNPVKPDTLYFTCCMQAIRSNMRTVSLSFVFMAENFYVSLSFVFMEENFWRHSSYTLMIKCSFLSSMSFSTWILNVFFFYHITTTNHASTLINQSCLRNRGHFCRFSQQC